MVYRIGSFNMQRFGANAKKDFEKIAQIIVEENLDVVALQEIWSEGKGVQRLLEQAVKYELYNWDMKCSQPSESADKEKVSDMIVNQYRGESYAFLWNKQKFKLLEYSEMGRHRVFEPRIINSMGNDVSVDCSFFARTPYYIRLQPIYGGFFELRMINIHIYFGDASLDSVYKRKVEYNVLVKDIYPEICSKRYGQNRVAYTVAMGDYNLNIFSPLISAQDKNAYLSEVYTFYSDQETKQVLTIQDQLTTLRDMERYKECPDGLGYYANNFDHFTYSPEMSPFKSVTCERIEAVSKYCDGDYAYYRKNISDHLPIVMTVEI